MTDEGLFRNGQDRSLQKCTHCRGAPNKPPLCKGRWLGFSRDGGIVCVVSDVGALRKHAGGMFLAIDRSSYAARREVTGRRGRRPLRSQKEYGKKNRVKRVCPLDKLPGTMQETALCHIIKDQTLMCFPRFPLGTLLPLAACSAAPGAVPRNILCRADTSVRPYSLPPREAFTRRTFRRGGQCPPADEELCFRNGQNRSLQKCTHRRGGGLLPPHTPQKKGLPKTGRPFNISDYQ